MYNFEGIKVTEKARLQLIAMKGEKTCPRIDVDQFGNVEMFVDYRKEDDIIFAVGKGEIILAPMMAEYLDDGEFTIDFDAWDEDKKFKLIV